MDHIELELRPTGHDAIAVHVAGARGEETLSGGFALTCTIDPASDGAFTVRELPGTEVVVRLRAPSGAERRFTGLVRAARGASLGTRRGMVLDIAPRAAVLAVGRGCRSFERHTVPEVATEILRQAGVAHRLDLARQYPRHDYLAQYREDDDTFLKRLLADEGIFTYFDHRPEETTLVLCDDSRLCPDIPARELDWLPDAGLDAAREHVLEVAFEGEALPTKVTVGSFSARRPDLRVRESAGDGPREIYLPPGAKPELPEECGRRAQQLLEDLDVRRRLLRGVATSPELAPGHRFALHGSAFDGSYLVVASTFEVRGRERFGEGQQAWAEGEPPTFRVRFTAVPEPRPLRPPPRPEPRHTPGLQGGFVVGVRGQEIHPDDEGRIRVRLHWDVRRGADEADGKWMRVAQRSSAESLLLPRMGWSVLTSSEDGASAAPEVLARIFDAEHRPPYALPEHRSRVVLKTATSPGGGSFNEICFEDAAGREELAVRGSRDLNMLVLRSASHTIGHDHDVTVGRDLAVQVALRSQEIVGGDHTTNVAGSQAIEVCGSLGQPVGGSLSELIGGTRSVKTATAASRSAAGTRRVAVGAAQLDATVGSISLSATGPLVHAVGGVHLRVAKQGMSETAGDDSRQAVGALRLEKAADNYLAHARRSFEEQAAGGISVVAGGRFVDGASAGATWSVGGQFALEGTTLLVEATDRIELVVGPSTVTLLVDAIEIAAPALDLSEASALAADTTKVEHN